MNWILLVIAGLFEVAFASCLSKAKETTGPEAYWWYAGFLICLISSMALLIKATYWNSLCRMDGHRSGGYRPGRYSGIQGSR
jgi:hypothetical protein